MLEDKKTVELYLDPQTYSEQEMMESIENAAREFSKKDVRVNIDINEWGVYVVKLDYIDRDTYFNEQIANRIYEPSNQIISIPKNA